MQVHIPRRVSLELIILGSLALIDALTTLYLLNAGLAEEANPVARFYVQKGPLWFLCLKMLPVGAMAFIEIKRIMDRKRMLMFMRVGLVVYASIYVSGMLAQYGRFAHPPQSGSMVATRSLKQGSPGSDAQD
jgi:hypothetical protein